jgi:hypothetical protein
MKQIAAPPGVHEGGTTLTTTSHCRGREPTFFSLQTLNEHRLLRTSVWSHIRSASIPTILSVPLIYALVVPFLLLDFCVAVYQSVRFPIYGIPKVRRSDYLIFDRGRLAYLNAIEKVGCVYCSDANGLLAYIAEIAARTEQHFCPIRHAHAAPQQHSRYTNFLPYGDARTYRSRSEEVSRAWGDLLRHEAHARSL